MKQSLLILNAQSTNRNIFEAVEPDRWSDACSVRVNLNVKRNAHSQKATVAHVYAEFKKQKQYWHLSVQSGRYI